jgi:hypothetical protein
MGKEGPLAEAEAEDDTAAAVPTGRSSAWQPAASSTIHARRR